MSSASSPRGDDALVGTIAGAFRATRRDSLAAGTRRASLSSAATQASAVANSPYGETIASLEDAELRSRGIRLIMCQDAVAKARADAVTANKEALEELDENFKFRNDERLLARAPMNRAVRASNRMDDATKALDADLNEFIGKLNSMMQTVERRRAEDVSRAEERLSASETSRVQARATHELESYSERLGRLKAALRLTGNWKSAILAGQRQADALVGILQSELAGIEAAWAADVQQRDAAMQAQAAASSQLLKEREEEFRRADESQREAHTTAMGVAQAAHDNAMSALKQQLHEEQAIRKKLELDLEKTQVDTARTILRLQTEVAGYRNYSSTANFALQSNTKALREEKQALQDQADQRLQSLRETMLAKQKELEQEVLRLRQVQEEVLTSGGALPGSEVRQYLFLEATKARRFLQPDATISWRGQHEQCSPKAKQKMHHRRPESARQQRAPPFSRGY